MSEFQEHHPLLNEDEFKDAAHNAGYDRAQGARIFTRLFNYRDLFTTGRTAETIGYHEINREGQPEYTVSIPNLAAQQEDLGEIPYLGGPSVDLVKAVIQAHQPAQK